MTKGDNKRGIKTVLRKIIKGKQMVQSNANSSLVAPKSTVVAIKDAQDEIPFAWKGDVLARKNGKKSTYRLIKKVVTQIMPKTSKND